MIFGEALIMPFISNKKFDYTSLNNFPKNYCGDPKEQARTQLLSILRKVNRYSAKRSMLQFFLD